MTYYTLSNGLQIPAVGFGTYKTTTGNDAEILKAAIEQGYRHFDTAAFYGNEEYIRDAIAASGLKREEFFLTSKLWKDNLGYEETYAAFEESCNRLGTDYLDMYLIHWPRPISDEEYVLDTWRELDAASWKAMEELYGAGKIKAIGLSNFLPHHIENLLKHAAVKPMVDQLELHPGYMQHAARDYCRRQKIQVEAWSPIGRARVMQEPVLIRLAEKYQRSIAQICLRFLLQNDILPLPKSSAPERMKQNMEVFDFIIDEEDMSVLETLPQLGWSGEHPDRVRIAI